MKIHSIINIANTIVIIVPITAPIVPPKNTQKTTIELTGINTSVIIVSMVGLIDILPPRRNRNIPIGRDIYKKKAI